MRNLGVEGSGESFVYRQIKPTFLRAASTRHLEGPKKMANQYKQQLLASQVQRPKQQLASHPAIRKIMESSFASSTSGSASSSYESGSSYDSETPDVSSCSSKYTSYMSGTTSEASQASKSVKGQTPYLLQRNMFDFPIDKNVVLKKFSQQRKGSTSSNLRIDQVSGVVKGLSMSKGPVKVGRVSEGVQTSNQYKLQPTHMVLKAVSDTPVSRKSDAPRPISHKAKGKSVPILESDAYEHHFYERPVVKQYAVNTKVSEGMQTTSQSKVQSFSVSKGAMYKPSRPASSAKKEVHSQGIQTSNQYKVQPTHLFQNAMSDYPVYRNADAKRQPISPPAKVNPAAITESDTEDTSYESQTLKPHKGKIIEASRPLHKAINAHTSYTQDSAVYNKVSSISDMKWESMRNANQYKAQQSQLLQNTMSDYPVYKNTEAKRQPVSQQAQLNPATFMESDTDDLSSYDSPSPKPIANRVADLTQSLPKTSKMPASYTHESVVYKEDSHNSEAKWESLRKADQYKVQPPHLLQNTMSDSPMYRNIDAKRLSISQQTKVNSAPILETGTNGYNFYEPPVAKTYTGRINSGIQTSNQDTKLQSTHTAKSAVINPASQNSDLKKDSSSQGNWTSNQYKAQSAHSVQNTMSDSPIYRGAFNAATLLRGDSTSLAMPESSNKSLPGRESEAMQTPNQIKTQSTRTDEGRIFDSVYRKPSSNLLEKKELTIFDLPEASSKLLPGREREAIQTPNNVNAQSRQKDVGSNHDTVNRKQSSSLLEKEGPASLTNPESSKRLLPGREREAIEIRNDLKTQSFQKDLSDIHDSVYRKQSSNALEKEGLSNNVQPPMLDLASHFTSYVHGLMAASRKSISSVSSESLTEEELKEPVKPSVGSEALPTNILHNITSDSPVYSKADVTRQPSSNIDRYNTASLEAGKESFYQELGKRLKHPKPLETQSSHTVKFAKSAIPQTKSENIKPEYPSESEVGFEMIPTNPDDDGWLYNSVSPSSSHDDARSSQAELIAERSRYLHVRRHPVVIPEREDIDFKKLDQPKEEVIAIKQSKESIATSKPPTYDGLIQKLKNEFEAYSATATAIQALAKKDGQYNLRQINEVFVNMEKYHKQLVSLTKLQKVQRTEKAKIARKPASKAVSFASRSKDLKKDNKSSKLSTPKLKG